MDKSALRGAVIGCTGFGEWSCDGFKRDLNILNGYLHRTICTASSSRLCACFESALNSFVSFVCLCLLSSCAVSSRSYEVVVSEAQTIPPES